MNENRPGLLRQLLCVVLILSTLPYMTLKLLWLTGNPVGFTDPSLIHDPAMIALNALTGGMDFVAVLLALTFTYRWGLRAPAWLVGFPLWVGTGLLGQILLSIPVVTAHAMLAPAPAAAAGPVIVQSWVYTLVYGGFTVEGITLILAFVLYAWARWGSMLRAGLGAVRAGITDGAQRVIGTTGAVIALVVAVISTYWACGGTAGIPDDVLTLRTFDQRVLDGASAAVALLGAAGILMLVYRIGRSLPLWVPVTMAWLGAGATAMWGGWFVVVAVFGSTVGAPTGMMLVGESFLRILAGVFIAITGAFLLAERATISR